MALTLSLKDFLVSIAVLFTALGLKAYVPLLMKFVSTLVPVMWNFFSSCFKPPYLFVIINAIIITIALSSRFHQSAAVDEQPERTPPPPKTLQLHAYERKSPPLTRPEIAIPEPLAVSDDTIEEPPLLELKAVVMNGSVAFEGDDEDKKGNNDIESAWTRIKKLDWTKIPSANLSPSKKPPVYSRLSHRKTPKANTEGVVKPKQHETLENTWKMITEGRAKRLSRSMKKCDTWHSREREINVEPLETTPEKVKKSESFRERPPMKLRKEPSLSQDELNRRVEAFIGKINEQMRLQRQESLNEYMQMINRGTN